MIIAIDVFYHANSNTATVAGVLFKNFNNETSEQNLIIHIDQVEPYISGEFYKREMPCICKLLDQVQIPISTIVIDGYVSLGEQQHPGLGMKLYQHLGGKTPIIGVAKNSFMGVPKACEVYRGKSKKPLFITSVGIELEQAKQHIQSMAGKDRFPLLLKEADILSRSSMSVETSLQKAHQL